MFTCKCGGQEFHTIGRESMNHYYNGDGDHLDTGDYFDCEIPKPNSCYTCTGCNKEYADMPPLSPEEEWLARQKRNYMRHNGAMCPICEGRDFEVGSLEIDGPTVWQLISCSNPDCGAEWTDVYELNHIDIDSYPTNLIPEDAKPPEVPNPNEVFKK